MKEIFDEVIKEASTGQVILDNEIWNINFNTIIYENNNIKTNYYKDENLKTLIIKNESLFLEYLEKYIEIELRKNRKITNFLHDASKNKIKYLISNLFINATTLDFNDPINYIKKRIDFLEDDTFRATRYVSLKNTFNLKNNDTIYLKIQNITQDIKMETPYRIELTLIDIDAKETLIFKLPSISYGICKENNIKRCYIYNIQNKKQNRTTEDSNKFIKKISRMLYKVNKGNIDEDLKDISASSVMALTIFLNILRTQNIGNITALLQLPIRNKLKNNSVKKSEKNEFLKTIRRVASQFEGINIKNIDTIDEDYIEFEISDIKYITKNPLLNNITNNILGRK